MQQTLLILVCLFLMSACQLVSTEKDPAPNPQPTAVGGWRASATAGAGAPRASTGRGESYVSPGYRVPQAFLLPVGVVKKRTTCGEFPAPYLEQMVFPSKYEGSDSARDELNEAAEARYLQLTASIKTLESLIAKWSDQYLAGNLGARECGLALIEEWARQGALSHKQINNMGQSVRKWALATLAVHYLKLVSPGNAPELDENRRRLIEDWFVGHAYEVKEYYSYRPLEKVNNHDYWAAWAVMLVATRVNDRELFDWSLEKYREAISQIDRDGYLPNEMARQTRALSYHNYALHPLVWLAVFAQANGVELSPAQSAALERLVNRTLEGLEDPEPFVLLTGHAQEMEGLLTPYNLAWMEVWVSGFKAQGAMNDYLVRYRPMRSTRLGGNLSLLFNRVPGRSAP